jgi:hypothetical protein
MAQSESLIFTKQLVFMCCTGLNGYQKIECFTASYKMKVVVYVY